MAPVPERPPFLGTRTYRTITPRSEDAAGYAAYPPKPPTASTAASEGVKTPLTGVPRPAPSSGNGQPAGDLPSLLWDLPYKAGKGTVKGNLEELLLAAFSYHRAGTNDFLDVSRLSGYLELEQRFGRIRATADPDHAAQLLVGALAHAGGSDEEHRRFAEAAVKIVLEGIRASEGAT